MFDRFKKITHVVAGVIGKAMRVKVVFGNQGPKTDGKVIYLPSDVAPPEAAIGFTIHEGAHIAHTDMEVFRAFAKAEGALGKHILNILEDVRIERRVCRRYRGARKRLLEAAQSLDWSEGPAGKPEDLVNWLLYEARRHDLPELFAERAKAFRPAAEAMVGTEVTSQIEGLAANALQAPDTEATAKLAKRILELLKNPMDQQQQQSQPQQRQSSVATDQDDGSGVQEADAQSQEGQDGSQGQGKADESGDTSSELGDATDPSQDDGGDELGSKASTTGGSSEANAGGDLLKDLEQALPDAEGDMGEKLKSKVASDSKGGTGASGSLETLQAVQGNLNGALDNALVARAASALQARMQTFTRVQRHLKDVGHQVATDRLACLAANDPNIFRRQGVVRAIDASVLILLDASGSMSHNQRCTLAGQAAVVAHNALLSLNRGRNKVESRVVGFSDRLLMVGKPNQRLHRAPNWALGGTPTEAALVQCLPDLVLSRRKEKVIFLMTDGQPNNPIKTAEVISTAKSEGFRVFTLLIGMRNSLPYQHIFGNDVVACPDATSIPMALAEAVGNAFNLPK